MLNEKVREIQAALHCGAGYDGMFRSVLDDVTQPGQPQGSTRKLRSPVGDGVEVAAFGLAKFNRLLICRPRE